MDDRIRIVGILGQRDIPFDKIHRFDDAPTESFTSRLRSLLTGAPSSSRIEVARDHSLFSGQLYLLVKDRDGFLRAAREALANWTTTRAISPSRIEPRQEA
jgi:hypothetical protein